MPRNPKGQKTKVAVAACCLIGMSPIVFADTITVDVGQENGRRDVLTPRALNWQIKNATTSTFDLGNGAQATLSVVGEGSLQGVLWKGGLDTGATLATDGVAATASRKIRLTISGLKPGKHALATFHNFTDAKPAGSLLVQDASLLNKRLLEPTVPSHRATRDDDVASAYFEFTGTEFTVEISPSEPTGVAILNGFELDGTNPQLRARHLSPAIDEEHAPEKPELTWTPGASATAHRVFFGESREAVANAEKSTEAIFKGEQTTAKYSLPAGLDHMKTYYWRVDEVAADGSVTRGRVASFRVRHLAFPGAEGYGRFARGGRGGRVIEVTNLEDSGPGSLRAAVEADGPRTVVFRVGGTITLKSRLTVKNPYITIAGQTAPGDGIAVRNAAFGLGGTQDAIMRYIRLRVGDESGTTWDGMGFGTSNHCIIDHCSIAWSIDEGVSGRGAKNITFQRNIITEPLNMSIHDHYVGTGKGHGYAGSISGDVGSFHHNLVANSAGRNWSLAGGLTQGGKFAGNLDIRNNVVYNWNHRTNDGGVRRLNLVNNYYIPGPASKVFHILKAVLELRLPDDIQQYYVKGNVMEGRPQYNADNWQNGGVEFNADDVAAMKVERPFYESYVSAHSALEGYASVMADVGANIPGYDAVDQRAIHDTANRTTTFKGSKTGLPGLPDSQKDVGGYPELKNGTPPADNDHDGMADWWEKERGLNPADPEDRNLVGAGGYTNLELYLNWIVDNGGLEKKAGQPIPAAQQAEQAALKVRAQEVTAKLGLEDKAKAERVTQIVTKQYQDLYQLVGARGTKVRDFEDIAAGAKGYGNQTFENVLLEEFATLQPKLDALRGAFLANLNRELTPAQVVLLKDAMTGNSLHTAYRNFTAMVPDLTEPQKQQIMAFLEEGREKAMDTITERQHRQWFAKYIGRTNNYIARQGYDFRRLSSEWTKKTGNTDVL